MKNKNSDDIKNKTVKIVNSSVEFHKRNKERCPKINFSQRNIDLDKKSNVLCDLNKLIRNNCKTHNDLNKNTSLDSYDKPKYYKPSPLFQTLDFDTCADHTKVVPKKLVLTNTKKIKASINPISNRIMDQSKKENNKFLARALNIIEDIDQNYYKATSKNEHFNRGLNTQRLKKGKVLGESIKINQNKPFNLHRLPTGPSENLKSWTNTAH